MRALFRIALVCLLPGIALAAPAQTSHQTAVDGIAQTIQDHYFDADRGRKIAADLRASTKQGEFDALPDQTALATALTKKLKPLDGHFRVHWSTDAVASGDAGPVPRPRRPSAPRAGDAANDHGICDVQVLPDNLGYLSLGQFMHFEFGSDKQPARQAIDAALQRLSGTRAMIIDLRGNRGGSPHMVGYLVSAFTPPGANIYNTFHSRESTLSEAPQERYANPRLEVPLYVLIDARTGSAAESFAYTLKNAKRATVVGEASGGAANPGGEMAAGSGFFVFVPTGSPVSPITGTNWEGTGVLPDVRASSPMALEVALGLAKAR
ncbi:S41 family peptidase [Pseudoxanthomonas sp. UTMC 1351]|uniref:S41 family peptidase n=1 Tax=Pseudoxanthomonas sp. UTMC 1351 TaxID=2695853 RepID=UPI0034CD3C60